MNSDLFELLFWAAVILTAVLGILAVARREFIGAATAFAVLALALAVAAPAFNA